MGKSSDVENSRVDKTRIFAYLILVGIIIYVVKAWSRKSTFRWDAREKLLEAGSGFRLRKRKCACELIRGTLTVISIRIR